METVTIYQVIVLFNGERRNERVWLTCTDEGCAKKKVIEMMTHPGNYISQDNHSIDTVFIRELKVSADGKSNEKRDYFRKEAGYRCW